MISNKVYGITEKYLSIAFDEILIHLLTLHHFIFRIEANYKVWDFELSPEDMALFHDLNVGWRHLLWAETSGHPDYPFKVVFSY